MPQTAGPNSNSRAVWSRVAANFRAASFRAASFKAANFKVVAAADVVELAATSVVEPLASKVEPLASKVEPLASKVESLASQVVSLAFKVGTQSETVRSSIQISIAVHRCFVRRSMPSCLQRRNKDNRGSNSK